MRRMRRISFFLPPRILPPRRGMFKSRFAEILKKQTVEFLGSRKASSLVRDSKGHFGYCSKRKVLGENPDASDSEEEIFHSLTSSPMVEGEPTILVSSTNLKGEEKAQFLNIKGLPNQKVKDAKKFIDDLDPKILNVSKKLVEEEEGRNNK